MKKVLYFIAILYLLLNLTYNCAEKLKSCSVFLAEQCPLNSKCTQNTTSCICLTDFEFNEKFHNDTDYCISKPKLQSNQPIEVDTTSAANLQQLNVTPVGSHHIIGGILIPVFIVLTVIASAYGLKRLEVIRKFREFRIQRRRRQPFYEDVMMNQDNDDPPLM